jgi:hypothetical protein
VEHLEQGHYLILMLSGGLWNLLINKKKFTKHGAGPYLASTLQNTSAKRLKSLMKKDEKKKMLKRKKQKMKIL